MSDEAPRPRLEIDLVEYGGDKFVFETPEQFDVWIRDERQRWDWLRNHGDGYSRYEHFLNEASNRSNEWRQNMDRPAEVTQIFERFKSRIKAVYEEGLLHSSSTDGKFIQKLRETKGPELAAAANHVLRKDHPRLNHCEGSLVEGIFTGILYQRDIDFSGQVHKSGLDELKSTYHRNLLEQRNEAAEIKRANTTLNDEFQQVLKSHEAALQKLHEDQGSQFARLMETSAGELDSVKKTYDEKLALQAPVKYWDGVRKKHQRHAGLFTALLIVLGALFAWCMHDLIKWTLEGVKPGTPPEHWQLGILLTVAFLGVWTLRIVLRLLMSNIHLSTDAAERSTMILTYLALVREGTDVAPDDKKLILQHLFRNASDGLVKDDAAPPGILELLTRGK